VRLHLQAKANCLENMERISRKQKLDGLEGKSKLNYHSKEEDPN